MRAFLREDRRRCKFRRWLGCDPASAERTFRRLDVSRAMRVNLRMVLVGMALTAEAEIEEKLAFAFLLFAEDDQNNQKKWYLEPVRGLTMLETMIRVLDAFFGVKCKKKSASDIRALAAGIASPGVRLRPFPYCISAPN